MTDDLVGDHTGVRAEHLDADVQTTVFQDQAVVVHDKMLQVAFAVVAA